MIELITGAPGAGKTTYAVAERLAKEARRVVEVRAGDVPVLRAAGGIVDEKDGKFFLRRRVVTAGFRGLVVEHEKLPHKLTGELTASKEVAEWNRIADGSEGSLVHERLQGEPPHDVPAIIENWWLWCRPGDLICVDEFQFVAERGTLGRKPPAWIQKFEIHRHYGVDWLVITQHPQLIDTTIRALVGLHRHIRPVMGSPICMVYTWDYASNPERYTMANKGTFRRKASHYKLFHSAVAHVKPPSSGRWALAVVPVLLAIFGVGFYSKVSGWVSPAKQVAAVKAPAPPVDVPRQPVGAPLPQAPTRPAGFVDVPKLQGCWAQGERCECQGTDGRPVQIALPMCRTSASSFRGLVEWEPRRPPDAEKTPKSEESSTTGPAAHELKT